MSSWMAWSDEDLRRMVRVLAAGTEEQVEWVREDGSYPLLDELALEFSYELDRVRARAMADQASAADRALLALDQQLEQMSGLANSPLWGPEALTGPEWSRVRELAVRALRALDD
jgi:hypothetical protein